MKHLESLDGLRGVAILSVLAYHFSDFPMPTTVWGAFLVSFVRSGWIGVDLFFVLSGFLITGLLLESRVSTNYFRVFYGRRALRLFPVYYLAVILMFWVIIPLAHRPDVLSGFFTRYPINWQPASEQVFYWLNLSNLRSAFYPLRIPFITVFWSLAIEEQFYLVWPLCVRYLTPRNIGILCGVGLIAGPILRNLPVVLAERERYPDFIYRLTPFHMDGLLCGALLAVALYTKWHHDGLTRLALFAVVPLLACLVPMLAVPRFMAYQQRVGFSVLALFFTAVLWLCVVYGDKSRWFAVLRTPFMKSLGRYSYFIYVFHLWIITYFAVFRDSELKKVWPFRVSPLVSYWATIIIAFSVCYGLGALSSRCFEGPILRLKRYLRYDRSGALMPEAQG